MTAQSQYKILWADDEIDLLIARMSQLNLVDILFTAYANSQCAAAKPISSTISSNRSLSSSLRFEKGE